MEVGLVNELTVLTPSEISWIERALGPLDAMARRMLTQGKARTTACSHSTGSARCGKAATHYTVDHSSGDLTGYCLDHWRTNGDPENTLKLDTLEEPTPASAAGDSTSNA